MGVKAARCQAGMEQRPPMDSAAPPSPLRLLASGLWTCVTSPKLAQSKLASVFSAAAADPSSSVDALKSAEVSSNEVKCKAVSRRSAATRKAPNATGERPTLIATKPAKRTRSTPLTMEKPSKRKRAQTRVDTHQNASEDKVRVKEQQSFDRATRLNTRWNRASAMDIQSSERRASQGKRRVHFPRRLVTEPILMKVTTPKSICIWDRPAAVDTVHQIPERKSGILSPFFGSW